MFPWISFTGPAWRLLFAEFAAHPLEPARAPRGRFHHDGQVAIYTSLSVEGAGVAIRAYVADDDAPRVLVPLTVRATRIADLSHHEGTGIPPVSSVWQDDLNANRSPATWAISDSARAAGAEGLLYPSRSRPDLLHLTLFTSDVLSQAGPPANWP